MVCETRGCFSGYFLQRAWFGRYLGVDSKTKEEDPPKRCCVQCCESSFHPKTLPRHIKANSVSLPLLFQLSAPRKLIHLAAAMMANIPSAIRPPNPLKPFIEPSRKACGLNPVAPPEVRRRLPRGRGSPRRLQNISSKSMGQVLTVPRLQLQAGHLLLWWVVTLLRGSSDR